MHSTDFFVHFSNVLLLISYSTRSMLWLRWFAVGASVTEIPYFVLRSNILWPPVIWAGVFTALNLYQIAIIYRERRPVVLSEDEQRLYDSAFRSLTRREFVSLVLAGEWKSAAPGDQPVTEGAAVPSVCVAISGALRITRKGENLATVPPGHLIGTALALTGHPSPVSAAFVEPGRYICWPLSKLRVLLDAKPELRRALQTLVNRDLSAKVEALLSAASSRK